MSAAVIALPTAALAPVVQRARRGPLPGSVRSITAFRSEREREQQELVASNIESVRGLCCRALERAMAGEFTGLAIIEHRIEGFHHCEAAGTFAKDWAYLQKSIDEFGEAVAESTAKEQNS
jgi:hypothetical protein